MQALDEATDAALIKVFTYWSLEKFQACFPSLTPSQTQTLYGECKALLERRAMEHYKQTKDERKVDAKLRSLEQFLAEHPELAAVGPVALETAGNPAPVDPQQVVASNQLPALQVELNLLEQRLNKEREEQEALVQQYQQKLQALQNVRTQVESMLQEQQDLVNALPNFVAK